MNTNIHAQLEQVAAAMLTTYTATRLQYGVAIDQSPRICRCCGENLRTFFERVDRSPAEIARRPDTRKPREFQAWAAEIHTRCIPNAKLYRSTGGNTPATSKTWGISGKSSRYAS